MGGKNTPDFQGLSQADTELGQEAVTGQTYANRPTQYSPFGYTNWTTSEVIDPATGKPVTEWSQTTGLTPELQAILDKNIAIQGGRSDIAGMLTGRLGSEYAKPIDFNNLSPMGNVPTAQFTVPEPGPGDPYLTRAYAEDAMFNQAMSRLSPQFESEQQGLELRMRNQGLRPEDAAWKSQVEGLGRKQTDARNQAIWSATEAGRAESGQMYGQQMGRSELNFNQALSSNRQNYDMGYTNSRYANEIRQQEMVEMMQQRGFTLNEINAIMNGQQVGMPSMPGFSGAGINQPSSMLQAGVADASARNAASPWSSIAGLAGAGLGAAATYAGLSAGGPPNPAAPTG